MGTTELTEDTFVIYRRIDWRTVKDPTATIIWIFKRHAIWPYGRIYGDGHFHKDDTLHRYNFEENSYWKKDDKRYTLSELLLEFPGIWV